MIMINKKLNIALLLLAGILIAAVFNFFKERNVKVELPKTQVVQAPSVGGVTNYLETSSNTLAMATTSISTAATQVFASLTKFGQITNNSTNTITCAMDATNTTAVSSSVVANRGIIIVPLASSTLYSTASFGECYPGSVNCYAHKGAVNCVISATSTITTWKK